MRARTLVVGLVAGAACAVAGIAALPANADPIKPMIVGGQPADQDYSFMASMQMNGKHRCGASLISDEWMVTAAHCVKDVDAKQLTFRIGSKQWASGGEEVKGAEAKIHPDYDGQKPGGDIALVKLASKAKSTPVKLADKAEPGQASRIIGWGQTCPQPGACGAPADLQQLDTKVLEADKCTEIDGKVELCTDNTGGNAGACYGDSGGPQVVKAQGGKADEWLLIGDTSRSGNGDSTCATGPSIYTSVVAYKDWVKENTGVGKR